MSRRASGWSVVALAILAAAAPATGQVRLIRLGDHDGFGLGDGRGLLNVEGVPVNVDGLGVLGPGDFLPDWNRDGVVMHFAGDDFDMRTAVEIIGTRVQAEGFADHGSLGAQFTDVTLSLSYDDAFGAANDFPDPPSNDRNDAVFMFDFEIPAADISPCTDVYFNLVFGDLGGSQASYLELTFADGSSITEVIPPARTELADGLVRAAFLEVSFANVFTRTGDIYTGFVIARLVTLPQTPRGDPYYAIDFAEISTVSAESCFGDVGADGLVGIDDLLAVLAAWGPCPDRCDPLCRADLVEDGAVNVNDLLAVLAAWGACP